MSQRETRKSIFERIQKVRAEAYFDANLVIMHYSLVPLGQKSAMTKSLRFIRQQFEGFRI